MFNWNEKGKIISRERESKKVPTCYMTFLWIHREKKKRIVYLFETLLNNEKLLKLKPANKKSTYWNLKLKTYG